MKNQPSNSTSWSDNALRLLVAVAVFQVLKMPFQSMNSTPKLFRLSCIRFESEALVVPDHRNIEVWEKLRKYKLHQTGSEA